MGFDTTAYRKGIDRNALSNALQLNDYDVPNWDDRYDAYRAATEVAYNRRGAGNPLNQVLYMALGVMDEETYAGCSGTGITHQITKQQLETAKEILAKGPKQFAKLQRARNAADKLVEMFQQMGATVVELDSGECDISQEQRFVDRCLSYLEYFNREEIEICFG